MQKTVVVDVTTLKKHPLYHKYVKTHKHFKADNPGNLYKVGDQVIIGAVSKPISHDKRWSVIKKSIRKILPFFKLKYDSTKNNVKSHR